jgi:dihydroorotate dehydrogenase (fumarate)
MLDLSTTYLGFTLPHPLMAGASPLADTLDSVRRLEDAGAAAIVLRSLFEEQITREQLGTVHDFIVADEQDARALSYFPRPDDFTFGPEEYLEHVRRIKAGVRVPVIGSLNGTTRAGWLSFARLIQEAGADALELNLYRVSTDPRETGAEVERALLDAVRQVKWSATIPIAVKLSPFYSSVSNLAFELDALGVNGLVLFNRFCQPDIDPEMLVAAPRLHLSTPDELPLRVRWLAILYGRVEASLAATGGVHTAIDALKAVMAGAHAVQVVSALLTNGPAHLARMRRELEHWLEEREYPSLRAAQGCMSLLHSAAPDAFERGSYMRILQSWRPRSASLDTRPLKKAIPNPGGA